MNGEAGSVKRHARDWFAGPGPYLEVNRLQLRLDLLQLLDGLLDLALARNRSELVGVELFSSLLGLLVRRDFPLCRCGSWKRRSSARGEKGREGEKGRGAGRGWGGAGARDRAWGGERAGCGAGTASVHAPGACAGSAAVGSPCRRTGSPASPSRSPPSIVRYTRNSCISICASVRKHVSMLVRPTLALSAAAAGVGDVTGAGASILPDRRKKEEKRDTAQGKGKDETRTSKDQMISLYKRSLFSLLFSHSLFSHSLSQLALSLSLALSSLRSSLSSIGGGSRKQPVDPASKLLAEKLQIRLARA